MMILWSFEGELFIDKIMDRLRPLCASFCRICENIRSRSRQLKPDCLVDDCDYKECQGSIDRFVSQHYAQFDRDSSHADSLATPPELRRLWAPLLLQPSSRQSQASKAPCECHARFDSPGVARDTARRREIGVS